ncbi:MAG TPA: hypothetical protein VLA74_04555 [Nitrososphaeraceae archaeon]|nr:hypothetical protein [Nitrososphaeraceae archaeon]
MYNHIFAAPSPSFERQEITDVDKDWIFWNPDSEEDRIYLQDNTQKSIPVAKNETHCKLDVEFSPQIKSVSYMSNGNRLNATMWMSSDLIEPVLEKNRLNKDNFEKEVRIPLWKKIKFTISVDINSIFNQGIDYRIELVNERINTTSSKWFEILYEISADGTEREVSRKSFDKFPFMNKNFVDFSIDLNKLSNPKIYKILLYVTDLYVNNGKLCRMVDTTSWIVSPPPNFNIFVSDNPINMKPGEQKDLVVTIKGNTGLQAEAELYVNKTDPSVSLSFPLSNKAIVSSLTNGSSTLHLNVSDSEFKSSKRVVFPIVANISFAPTITNKGGDTFYNNKTTFLPKTVDLTVNIERSLSTLEKFEEYVNFLRPIGDVWQILTPIGAAILSLIYFIARKKKGKEKKEEK